MKNNHKFFKRVDLIIIILSVIMIIGLLTVPTFIKQKEAQAREELNQKRKTLVDELNKVLDDAVESGKEVNSIADAKALIKDAGYDITEITANEPYIYYYSTESKCVYFHLNGNRYSRIYPYDREIYDSEFYLLDNDYYNVSTTIEDVTTNIDLIEVDDSDAYVIRLYGDTLPDNLTITGVDSFEYNQQYGFITVKGVTDNIVISASDN